MSPHPIQLDTRRRERPRELRLPRERTGGAETRSALRRARSGRRPARRPASPPPARRPA